MLLRMFAFYDTKAQVYGVPFFMINGATAMRAAIELAGDQSTTIGRHPADFILHELAIYDDASGRVAPHQAPVDFGLVSSMLPASPAGPLFATAGQE